MKALGYVLVAIGGIWLLVALNMDTTVVTEYGTRVNNIGLMSSRQTQTIVAGFITLFGVIIAVSGRSSTNKGSTVKCPYCAEPIQKEAIKCKHCGSDLVPNSTLPQPLNISEFNVTRLLGGKRIIDGYKVAELAKAIRVNSSTKSTGDILKEYSSQLNNIKITLPPELSESFDDLLRSSLDQENRM